MIDGKSDPEVERHEVVQISLNKAHIRKLFEDISDIQDDVKQVRKWFMRFLFGFGFALFTGAVTAMIKIIFV